MTTLINNGTPTIPNTTKFNQVVVADNWPPPSEDNTRIWNKTCKSGVRGIWYLVDRLTKMEQVAHTYQEYSKFRQHIQAFQGCQVWEHVAQQSTNGVVLWDHAKSCVRNIGKLQKKELDSGVFGQIQELSCCDGKHAIILKSEVYNEPVEGLKRGANLLHECLVGSLLNQLILNGMTNFVWTHGLVAKPDDEVNTYVTEQEIKFRENKQNNDGGTPLSTPTPNNDGGTPFVPCHLYLERVEGIPLSDFVDVIVYIQNDNSKWKSPEKKAGKYVKWLESVASLEEVQDYKIDEIVGQLLLQVYLALLAAGQHCRFSHLDLHPGNILIRRSTDQEYKLHGYQISIDAKQVPWQPVIIDFGRASVDCDGLRYVAHEPLWSDTVPFHYDFLMDAAFVMRKLRHTWNYDQGYSEVCKVVDQFWEVIMGQSCWVVQNTYYRNWEYAEYLNRGAFQGMHDQFLVYWLYDLREMLARREQMKQAKLTDFGLVLEIVNKTKGITAVETLQPMCGIDCPHSPSTTYSSRG